MLDNPIKAGPDDADDLLPHNGSPFLDWLRETVLVITMALILSIGLRTFIFQAFYVPSPSMETTLMRNDRIIASKITKHFSAIKRGDVIVFSDPSDWLMDITPEPGVQAKFLDFLTWVGILPSNTGQDLVKRVIGIGGDHVMCCDAKGGIVVNGYSIDESGYAVGRSDIVKFDIVVPKDHYFVMGDNREFSADSRYHLDQNKGTVPDELVVGQVVSLIWPLDRFGSLSNPLSSQPIPDPAP